MFRALQTSFAGMLGAIDEPTTRRAYRFNTMTRYSHPVPVRMYGMSEGRRLPIEDIGTTPIAAASRMRPHITIDYLAVELSFHFVRHSQALGDTTR